MSRPQHPIFHICLREKTLPSSLFPVRLSDQKFFSPSISSSEASCGEKEKEEEKKIPCRFNPGDERRLLFPDLPLLPTQFEQHKLPSPSATSGTGGKGEKRNRSSRRKNGKKKKSLKEKRIGLQGGRKKKRETRARVLGENENRASERQGRICSLSSLPPPPPSSSILHSALLTMRNASSSASHVLDAIAGREEA